MTNEEIFFYIALFLALAGWVAWWLAYVHQKQMQELHKIDYDQNEEILKEYHQAVMNTAVEIHKWRERAEIAENEVEAGKIRTQQIAAMIPINEDYNRITKGLRDKLQDGEHAPFGKWTGHFKNLSSLVLYLIFNHPNGALRPPEKRG